jgi:hypothetical protein
MIRCLSAAIAAVGLLAFCAAHGTGQGGKPGWGTVRGRIVWGGEELPKPQPAGAAPRDEALVINPANRGVKWAAVSLYGPSDRLPVHPRLRRSEGSAEVVLDRRGVFSPRMAAMREGQDLLLTNGSAVVRNVRWAGDPDINWGGDVNLPAGRSFTVPGLKAQKLPLILQDTNRLRVEARLMVYDHPYFAVTDQDGKFEIRLAPAGTYRLVVYHEGIGWRGGAKGKNGEPITIKTGAVTDLGDLKMGK